MIWPKGVSPKLRSTEKCPEHVHLLAQYIMKSERRQSKNQIKNIVFNTNVSVGLTAVTKRPIKTLCFFLF